MAGLIDDNTGLAFGEGLQFQTPIGGGGLIIDGGVVSRYLEWGSGDFLLWGGVFLAWGDNAPTVKREMEWGVDDLLLWDHDSITWGDD